MNNDLKNFLEERYNKLSNGVVMDAKKEDIRLINFVLDLVEKESRQTKTKEFSDQVTTIINNLRV